MAKIAFIAPDKQLFLQGKKIIHELGLQNKVSLHLARLKRGIRLAKTLEQHGVEVIVCRGGTARVIIKSRIRIPVVEIPITGQDLAQVFHEAKRITGLSRPKVAMMAFDNMVYDIEILSTILGIDLTIYHLEKTEDIPAKIEEAATTDVDLVVGGIKTILLFACTGSAGDKHSCFDLCYFTGNALTFNDLEGIADNVGQVIFGNKSSC